MNKEEKIKEGIKNRERYLQAKALYDRLNKHIEEYHNGTFVHDGPTLTIATRTQGKRHEALEEVFLCLSSQTSHDFEYMIIAHNATPEAIKHIEEQVKELPEWLQKQTHIVPLNEGNRTRPLNYAMANAKGLYVCFLDDDDLVMEDYVESFVESIKKEYGKIMHAYNVPQDWITVPYKGHTLLRAYAEPLDIYCRPFSIENEMTMNFCPFMGQAFPVFAYRELGIHFDETLDTTEDWDYLMRCSSICGVYDIKKVTAVYRMWKNTENSHTEHNKKVWDDNYKMLVKRFADMEIIFPFKKGADTRYPTHVDLFYSEGKGSYTAKKHFNALMEHDDAGTTIVTSNRLEGYGPIQSLRFDPDADGNRIINNYSITLELEDGSIYDISKANKVLNGAEHAQNSFTFIEDDPQICYTFDKPIVLKSITIKYYIDEFIRDKKYKPKKARRSFIKRCKNKIKKILRWIKQRL